MGRIETKADCRKHASEREVRMAKAIWNDAVIAEGEQYEMVEGNVYFQPGSVKKQYLRESDTDYECPWKGHADYYDIVVGDKVNKDAAWYYPDPKPAAKQIKGHVAFDRGKGVRVER
jgi:uncharacterized protein (DUF427 family)